MTQQCLMYISLSANLFPLWIIILMPWADRWIRSQHSTMANLVPIYFDIIAFFCTVGAITLAISHIYKHLINYTEPTYQRYIVRIIFMVPVSILEYYLIRTCIKITRIYNSMHKNCSLINLYSMFFCYLGQVYALMSFLSLVLNDAAIYFNSIREM